MKNIHKKWIGLWALSIFVLGLQGCTGHFLQIAVRKNDTFEVKRLLAHHPGVSQSTKQSSLQTAINLGYYEVAKGLIEHGADVNYRGPEPAPLIKASQRGREDIAGLLVAGGADVNGKAANGDTPLICAARGGNPGIVKLLVAHGADVQVGNADGDTALILAACGGNLKVVEFLIERGADLNARNSKGDTPISSAYGKGYHAIVETLLFSGSRAEKEQLNDVLARLILRMAPPTELNIDQKTQQVFLTQWDAESSQKESMPKLVKVLKMGADPNALRISGYTRPFGSTWKSENAQMTTYVAGTPGKIVPSNENGQTLLKFCRELELKRAGDLLVEHGAK